MNAQQWLAEHAWLRAKTSEAEAALAEANTALHQHDPKRPRFRDIASLADDGSIVLRKGNTIPAAAIRELAEWMLMITAAPEPAPVHRAIRLKTKS